jgi:hypothetical protein
VADYCSLALLKQSLGITDTVDDALLTTAITTASRFIDQHCERSFAPASGTATRDYAPTGRYDLLYIDDATSIVSVRIDDDLDYSFGTTLTNVDYQLEPLNGRAGGIDTPYYALRPFEDGYWPLSIRGNRATVRVEATFGWAAVPDVIEQATVLQASRIFKRLDSPLGVAGFGDMGVMRVSSRVDPDVAQLISAYRKILF